MIVCFYALFAFIANFCREVVKDIQDMEGDLKIGVRSFAIVWGIKKTQILISVSTLVLLVVFYIGTTTVSVPQKDVFQLFMALAISLASIVNMIFVLLKRWNLSNLTLKLSMILGTISLFFP
jgi:4-hydroxybenzoate polyprenyltransferase